LQAVALERAEIICVAEFGADFFKKIPVVLLALRANLLLQMMLEVGSDTVVIEERIVHVEQKDDIGHGATPPRALSPLPTLP